MYTPLVRLAFVATCLVFGALGLRGGFWWAWLWLAAVPLLIIGYWRSGTVWLAWRAMRRGDLARAERRLAQVPAPERLSAQQRAYYDWLQGEVHRAREDLAGARRHFSAAAEGGLRRANDRAIVYSRLAEAALTAGDPGAARDAVARARALSPKPPLEALLRDLEEAMARSGSPRGTP